MFSLRLTIYLSGLLVAAVCVSPAFGQADFGGMQRGGFGGAGGGLGGSGFGGGGLGGGVNAGTGTAVGTTQGLTQGGQLQSGAAMQRDQSAFIGRSGGEHPRSMANQAAQSVNGQFRPNTAGGIGGLAGIGGAGLGGMGMGGLGGGLGGRGMGGLGGLSGGLGGPMMAMNQFGAMGMGQQMGGQQMGAMGNRPGQQQIRTRTSLGFQTVPTSSTVVSQRFSQRISRLPGLGDMSEVTVEMDGNVVVLSGAVLSTRDRDLVAQLALLEPGIQSVRNELRVATETAAIPTPPLPGQIP